jgi:hypothetical protein
MPHRPCTLCGAIDYPLSLGGPYICPSCDCGISPEVSKLRRENAQLRSELEEARRSILRPRGQL